MSAQDKSLIDRNVIELRQVSFEEGIGKYAVTFDNGITLEETYEMGSIKSYDGKTTMSASDFDALLKIDNNPTLRYHILRKLGTCIASTIIEGDADQEPTKVAIDDEQVSTEGFLDVLGGTVKKLYENTWRPLLSSAVSANDIISATSIVSNICISRGSSAAKEIPLLCRAFNNSAAASAIAIAGAYITVREGLKETKDSKFGLETFENDDLIIREPYLLILKRWLNRNAEPLDENPVAYNCYISEYVNVDKGELALTKLEFYALGALIKDILNADPDNEHHDESLELANSYIDIACKDAADHAQLVTALTNYRLQELCANLVVASEEMMFGAGLPKLAAADPDCDIYKNADKLVTDFKLLKLKNKDRLTELHTKLLGNIEDNEEPKAADLLIGAYALLFGIGDTVKVATPYLKHVKSKGNEAEANLATKILDAIDDGSIVQDIPMLSYCFDEYDKDIEADMLEACKLASDGKTEEELNKIKFALGKESARKFKENDDLCAYDYYCLAYIFEHADTDAKSNDAIEKGLKLTKQQGNELDELHFKLLKKQLS